MSAEAARRRHRKTLGRRLPSTIASWPDCKARDQVVDYRSIEARARRG